MLALASEEKVALTADAQTIAGRLQAFRATMSGGKPLFLKFPLSALLIPELCRAFRTRLVYVLRPLEEIEATRKRRGWPEHLGAVGARRIYARMFDVLVQHRFATLIVRYPELIDTPAEIARGLARFAGLEADAPTIEKAAAFIRKGGT